MTDNDMHYQCIETIEEFYMDRMSYLVDQEQFDDSHALFTEFVIDTEEPDEWIFLNDISESLK
jgi:trans-2-enoyl-CoA reductase